MDQLWRRLIHLVLIIQSLQLCNCLPIANPSQDTIVWQWTTGLLALTLTVCFILVVIGCLCCQHRKGFQPDEEKSKKEFTNTSVAASAGSLVGTDLEQGSDPGLVNPIAAITSSSSEFTIFRPLSPSHHNNNLVVAASQSVINRTSLGAKRITEVDFQPNDDVNHWFDDSESNFPRNKLKYVKELGRGWFGRVIAGEAAILNADEQHQVSPGAADDTKNIPVVVRVLEADAGPRERAAFLREARIYYHTSHPNIMPLHGRCLEVAPLLLIQPYYSQGDLKKYLREHENDISDKTFLLRLCWELTNALEYLSHRNISHPDLALRNCQLSDQMSLCLGDYGYSPQLYPEDYYPGTPPVPVRWCAPENVICTQTTIQPKSVTCLGNVWSLGVVFWEIISFGKQPYATLSDDDVVTLVLEKQQSILEEPQTPLPYTHNIYQLSRLCCSTLETRPPITQVQSMLSILLQSNDTLNAQSCEPVSDSEFLARWNSLKPNTIVKTDNHTPEHSRNIVPNGHPLQIDISPPTNSDRTLSANSTVHYDTKQLSPASTVNSDCFINDISANRREKSLSLTNLHGSLENLIASDDQNISKSNNTNPFITPEEKKVSTTEQNAEYESWLENIASQNKEDLSYVKGLSQAMQELDSALALEKSSSSSETSHQPSPGPESWTDQQKQQITPIVSHTKIDFKLGPLVDDKIISDSINLSSEPDSLLDSILHPRSNSGSETEDETWRKRIERGAYSEKVRIKSKSVADLMVLTHIDTDTDSETPFPSLDYKSKISLKSNFIDSLNKPYGSEGNLNVVQDTFQEELKKLQEARRDSLLFVPLSETSVTNDSNSESQNKTTVICDQSFNDKLEKVPSLNIINASSEDLSIIEDLNHPFHVFLQKRESSSESLKNRDTPTTPEISENSSESNRKDDLGLNMENEEYSEHFANIPSSNTESRKILEPVQNLKPISTPVETSVTLENLPESAIQIENKEAQCEIHNQNQNDQNLENNTQSNLISQTQSLNLISTPVEATKSQNERESSDQKSPSHIENKSSQFPKIDPNLEFHQNAETVSSVQNLDLISTLDQPIKPQNQTEIFERTENSDNGENLKPDSSIQNLDLIPASTESLESQNKTKTESPIYIENSLPKTEIIELDHNLGIKPVQNFDLLSTLIDSVEPQSKLEISKKVCSELSDHIANTSLPKTENVEIDQNFKTIKPIQNLDLISTSVEVAENSCESPSHIENKSSAEKTESNQNLEQTFDIISTLTESDQNINQNQVEISKESSESSSTLRVNEELVESKISPVNIKQCLIPCSINIIGASNDDLFNLDDSDLDRPLEMSSKIEEDLNNLDNMTNVITFTQDFLNNEISFNSPSIESPKDCDSSLDNNFQNLVTSTPAKSVLLQQQESPLDVSDNQNETFDINPHDKQEKIAALDDATFSLDPPNNDKRDLSTILELTETTMEDVDKDNKTFNDATFSVENPQSESQFEKPQLFQTTVDDLENRTIDLAQTVSNLANDSLDLTIPKRPPEFNVMRFEVIPQYNFESSNVILGPCDDYTLDLYTGLKTTFVDNNDHVVVNEDELYHFSTNFSNLNAEIKSTDESNSSDMFLNKVPPVTPDLSSIITPCDSLEEHAMNTTFALKSQAEQIVNNVIKDAEKIVRGKLFDESNNKYDFVPEIRNVIDEIIYKAECFVAERLMQTSLRSDYFDGSDTIETPQLDSLEFNANSILDSSSSINKTVILKQNMDDPDKTMDVPNNLTKYESSYTLHEDVSGYSLELGWFLHPTAPTDLNNTDLPPIEGTIEDNESPPTSDNSYVGFSLDEECVAALRNELAAKLPHAQGPSIEPETQDEWECEPGTSEQHDEVILRYNVFAAPLSPIAEESEEFDCPTPEITPCREDSDSECEWSGGCFDPCDTDTRTPRAGSPNAAGRRSSRHRHTPSMDSCCSNDTLFNIEDLNGGVGENGEKFNNEGDTTLKSVPVENEPNDEKSILINIDDKIEELITQEISKVTSSQEENPTNEIEAFDTSDVYPSSTERIEAEPSTQEINSDYFSPTRNDFLSQDPSLIETKNSSERQVNSLKLEKKLITPATLIETIAKNDNLISEDDLNKKNEQLLNGEIISQCLEPTDEDVCLESTSEKSNKTYTLSDILQHLEDTKTEKPSENPSESYTMSDILKHLEETPPTKMSLTETNSTSKPTPSDFLDLKFEFKEELTKTKNLAEELTNTKNLAEELTNTKNLASLDQKIFQVRSLTDITTDFISSKHFLSKHGIGLRNGEKQLQSIIDICQKYPSNELNQKSEKFTEKIPPCEKETRIYANLIDHKPISETEVENKTPKSINDETFYANVDPPVLECPAKNELQDGENSGIETPLYASINEIHETILIREDSIDSLIDAEKDAVVEQIAKNLEENTVLYENIKETPKNLYENIQPAKTAVTKRSTSNHSSFDDDSVLKFYENIPTSPVHDDKIIESLYENIDKVNDAENFEKLFGLNSTTSDKKSNQNLYENVKTLTDENLPTSYHKLYENIEKSKDFPYENKFDRGGLPGQGSDSIDNSQSENGHHDSADDTYDKVYTASEDLYSDITDIRFSGPCDTQLMSTSFSDPHGGSDDQDWDSGSESRSSSSGEFVWKEGEHEASVRVLQAPSANDEKPITNETHSGLSTPDDDSCSTSSGEDGEGLEFVPSAWDSQAAPLKSALRSPDKTVDKCDRKRRGVWFKKQKYHCVYEYPREPDFSPPEWTPQPYNSGIWGTPTASDLSSFADWELDTENVLDEGSGSLGSSSQDFDLDDDTISSRYTRRDYFRRPGDLYRLADVVPDIDFTTGLSITDDDFYVTSSSKPFQSCSSQFFPGQLQYMSTSLHENSKTSQTAAERERTNSILEFANDLKKLHSLANSNTPDSRIKGDSATPDSGVEDITPASISGQSPDVIETGDSVTNPTSTISTHHVSTLKSLAENSLKQSKKEKKSQDTVMGGLRHTRDRLKLDLPPSPTSFSANRIFNLDISSDTTCSSHREREPPTFTTFGKSRFSVKHVDTPTEEVDISVITNSNKVTKLPMAVTHTAHTVHTDNTTVNNTEHSNNSPDICDKRRSVEIVRGEASLLDSADEDSGIESSANATLERQSTNCGNAIYTEKDQL